MLVLVTSQLMTCSVRICFARRPARPNAAGQCGHTWSRRFSCTNTKRTCFARWPGCPNAAGQCRHACSRRFSCTARTCAARVPAFPNAAGQYTHAWTGASRAQCAHASSGCPPSGMHCGSTGTRGPGASHASRAHVPSDDSPARTQQRSNDGAVQGSALSSYDKQVIDTPRIMSLNRNRHFLGQRERRERRENPSLLIGRRKKNCCQFKPGYGLCPAAGPLCGRRTWR